MWSCFFTWTLTQKMDISASQRTIHLHIDGTRNLKPPFTGRSQRQSQRNSPRMANLKEKKVTGELICRFFG